MKNLSFIITLVIFLSFNAFTQNRKIEFIEKPWSDILALSREQNKLIFLDAYTSWCGPCKWMTKNMFTKDSIADFYNSKFICATIDMEKGEGPELAKKYRVNVYPTLLFINSEGIVLHRKAGAPQLVKDYINMGNTAMNPETRLATLEKSYNSGNRTPEFISVYLKMMAEAYLPYKKVLNEYFSTQNESTYITRGNWNLIYQFVEEPGSPQFTYLVKNRDRFVKLYSEDSVDSKISTVYENALTTLIRKKVNDSIYNIEKEKIRSTGVKGANKIIFNSDMVYYQSNMKKEKFINLTYNDLEKFYSNDAEMLNNVAWSYANMVEEKKYLDKALEWSKRSIELKEDPNYIDTYATLLLKSGNKEQAIKQQKAAIELAKKQGVDVKPFEAKLLKMSGE